MWLSHHWQDHCFSLFVLVQHKYKLILKDQCVTFTDLWAGMEYNIDVSTGAQNGQTEQLLHCSLYTENKEDEEDEKRKTGYNIYLQYNLINKPLHSTDQLMW